MDYVLCKRYSDFLYLVTCCLFSPFSKDGCSLDRESSIFISFMIEAFFSGPQLLHNVSFKKSYTNISESIINLTKDDEYCMISLIYGSL